MTPAQKARASIHSSQVAAGWCVCNVADVNLNASTGVVTRESPFNPGLGYADYLLSVNGRPCDVIKAKKDGATLTGGTASIRNTNGLDLESRVGSVFACFRPEQPVQVVPSTHSS